jgi:hypothetical protein
VIVYKLGSKGPEVSKLQGRLAELQLYAGPVDGIFGGGTEAAVRAFQRSSGLPQDGQVGDQTWSRLFPAQSIPVPALADQPLAQRCLALSGSFETNRPVPDCFAGLSGNFDGQGISFGALQWNIGQRSLQPLLRAMNDQHAETMRAIFGTNYQTMLTMLGELPTDQLAWAGSIQDPLHHAIHEPWRGQFLTLGRDQDFQRIELDAAHQLHVAALALCSNFQLRSQRAVALMFDIKVQNGSISPIVEAQIRGDFAQVDPGADEVERLRIVANRRADAVKSRWIEDVRTRKLTIANGSGRVHGVPYDLEAQYGISLTAAALN